MRGIFTLVALLMLGTHAHAGAARNPRVASTPAPRFAADLNRDGRVSQEERARNDQLQVRLVVNEGRTARAKPAGNPALGSSSRQALLKQRTHSKPAAKRR